MPSTTEQSSFVGEESLKAAMSTILTYINERTNNNMGSSNMYPTEITEISPGIYEFCGYAKYNANGNYTAGKDIGIDNVKHIWVAEASYIDRDTGVCKSAIENIKITVDDTPYHSASISYDFSSTNFEFYMIKIRYMIYDTEYISGEEEGGAEEGTEEVV